MSQGDAILVWRPYVRERFICVPAFATIAPDRPAGQGPEALFSGLDGNWIPTYSGRADFAIQKLQAVHEHGHEIEAQVEARGIAKPTIRQGLWTRRQFPGTAAQQLADVQSGVYGPPGSMNYWMNHPVEIVAESIRCAIEGPNEPNRSAGNPGRTMDWGKTIQHAAELAWWQEMVEGAVIKVWIGPDQPVTLDALGDTPKPGGLAIAIPAGQLSAGVVTQGFAQRIGIAGTETGSWGTAEFVVDSSGTSGKLHVRGGFPKPGLAYYRMSAEQKV